MPRQQNSCPICHKPGQGAYMSPGSVLLGRHLLSKKHQEALKRIPPGGPEELSMRQWETELRTEAAINRFLQSPISQSYRLPEAASHSLAIEIENIPPNLPGVAEESLYNDDIEFEVLNDHTSYVEDMVGGQVASDNDSLFSEVVADEDIVDDWHLSEEGQLEESSSEEGPDSGQHYGHPDESATDDSGNEPASSSSFFKPGQGPLRFKEHISSWAPFDSEIDACLYLLCFPATLPISEIQIKRFLWFCRRFITNHQIPTLSKLKSYRDRLPKPQVDYFETSKGEPYYQISLLDIVRMQTCIPASHDDPKVPQQYPEVLHRDFYPIAACEIWQGEKWRTTPQLHRPVETIDIDGRPTNVWIGDIVKLYSPPVPVDHGIYAGSAVYKDAGDGTGRDETATKYHHFLPLTRPTSDSWAVKTKNGIPDTSADNVLIVRDELVAEKLEAESFGNIQGTEDGHSVQPLSEFVYQSWFSPHPLKQVSQRVQLPPIVQMNINLWNDGVSTVKSSRWNPAEIWACQLAGLPRKANFLDHNLHFIAAGRHLKAGDMMPTIIEQQRRLQRGIVGFDVSERRKIVICGSWVMGIADNPAASEAGSHGWQSKYPCRLCLYSPSNVNTWEDVCQSSTVRDIDKTRAATTKIGGIGHPLNITYDLPGFNPHFDWNFEVLHSVLLGIVKYAWIETHENKYVKPYLGTLALMYAAANKDTMKHAIGRRQILNWYRSLNGSDFRAIVSLWPMVMLQLCNTRCVSSEVKEFARLWWLTAKLATYLYQTVLPNIAEWADKVSQLTKELVSVLTNVCGLDFVSKKIKIHLLTHLGFWARRFGPPVAASAERFESLNKRIRRDLELTNRHSGSKDLAMKRAYGMGIRFVFQGGMWNDRMNPSSSEQDETTWTQAGHDLRRSCCNPVIRELLGLPQTGDENADSGLMKPVFYTGGTNQVMSTDQVMSTWDPGFTAGNEVSFKTFQQCHMTLPVSGRVTIRVGSFVRLRHYQEAKLAKIVAIMRGLDSNEGFCAVHEYREASHPPALILPSDACLYAGDNQTTIVHITTITGLVNFQHLCSNTGCHEVSSSSAWRMERRDMDGQVWKHDEDNGLWISNNFHI